MSRKIKREYNKPFFSNRSRGGGGWLFAMGLLVGILGVIVYLRFDEMQLAALEVIGIAPTATAFASDHAQAGTTLYAQGDVPGAEREFFQAVSQQPQNVDYLYEYGLVLIELDRSSEAAIIGDQAIAAAPDDVRGYVLKARALMWEDPAVAIPTAMNGLEIDPDFAPLHGALAVAYTNIGRYQEGLTRGARAIELDPLDAGVRRAYSIPLIYTGRNSQAIEQLEQAVAINPNLSAPYFELAAQYRAIDFPEMAVSIYHRVIDLGTDDAKANLRLCETYASVGEFITAQDYCEIALEIDSEYASAHRMLGQMQYSRRNYEGSIESFESCVRFGSREVECFYIRGLAHYFLGQCELAWNVLQESLTIAVQQPIIDNILQGMDNVTKRCPGYQDKTLPTPIPPTRIPPTPIGGL